jgi:hypothetical protein
VKPAGYRVPEHMAALPPGPPVEGPDEEDEEDGEDGG